MSKESYILHGDTAEQWVDDHVGTAFLTISFVLDQVLAFKELARWIISFTNSTSIQHSFGTKSMITPYLLQPKGTSEGLRHKGIWRNSCIFHKGVNCPLKKIDIRIVRNFILLHIFHQCKHRMYLENTEFHPSLCWTLQRKSQSLQLCNTIYICLPLGKKNNNKTKERTRKY